MNEADKYYQAIDKHSALICEGASFNECLDKAEEWIKENFDEDMEIEICLYDADKDEFLSKETVNIKVIDERSDYDEHNTHWGL